MPNRGSYNRRTGKSTPRNKVKTHWAKGGKRRAATPKKTAKPAVAGSAKK